MTVRMWRKKQRLCFTPKYTEHLSPWCYDIHRETSGQDCTWIMQSRFAFTRYLECFWAWGRRWVRLFLDSKCSVLSRFAEHTSQVWTHFSHDSIYHSESSVLATEWTFKVSLGSSQKFWNVWLALRNKWDDGSPLMSVYVVFVICRSVQPTYWHTYSC
jgi:hypothetical protein